MSIRLQGGPMDGLECNPTSKWFLCEIYPSGVKHILATEDDIVSVAAYKDGQYVRSLDPQLLLAAIKAYDPPSIEQSYFEDVLEIYDRPAKQLPGRSV